AAAISAAMEAWSCQALAASFIRRRQNNWQFHTCARCGANAKLRCQRTIERHMTKRDFGRARQPSANRSNRWEPMFGQAGTACVKTAGRDELSGSLEVPTDSQQSMANVSSLVGDLWHCLRGCRGLRRRSNRSRGRRKASTEGVARGLTFRCDAGFDAGVGSHCQILSVVSEERL